MYASKSSNQMSRGADQLCPSAGDHFCVCVCVPKSNCVSILLLLFCRGDKKETSIHKRTQTPFSPRNASPGQVWRMWGISKWKKSNNSRKIIQENKGQSGGTQKENEFCLPLCLSQAAGTPVSGILLRLQAELHICTVTGSAQMRSGQCGITMHARGQCVCVTVCVCMCVYMWNVALSW